MSHRSHCNTTDESGRAVGRKLCYASIQEIWKLQSRSRSRLWRRKLQCSFCCDNLLSIRSLHRYPPCSEVLICAKTGVWIGDHCANSWMYFTNVRKRPKHNLQDLDAVNTYQIHFLLIWLRNEPRNSFPFMGFARAQFLISLGSWKKLVAGLVPRTCLALLDGLFVGLFDAADRLEKSQRSGNLASSESQDLCNSSPCI